MPQVGFISVGAVLSNGNGTVPMPAGWQVGDLLVLVQNIQVNDTHSSPAGYTDLSGERFSNTGSDSASISVSTKWKFAEPGETGPTVNNNNNGISYLICFRGVKVSAPIADSQRSAAGGTTGTAISIANALSCPALSMVCAVAASGNSVPTFSSGGWSAAGITSETERLDTNGGDSQCAVGMWTGVCTAGGTSGTFSATASAAGDWVAIHFALEPSVAYTIAIAAATYTLTGSAVTFKRGKKIAIAPSTYALTGAAMIGRWAGKLGLESWTFGLGGGADSFWANTRLLLLGTGADGTPTITDYSTDARAVTTVGNAQNDADISISGGSIKFDGTGDALTVPHADEFSTANGPRTWEAWVRPAEIGRQQAIMSKRGAADTAEWKFYFTGGNVFKFRAYAAGGTKEGTAGVAVSLIGTTIIQVGVTYHVAVVRQGGVWRLYVNGKLEATDQSVVGTAENTEPLQIGRDLQALTEDFNGNLNWVRMSNAVRYTGNFTPQIAYPFATPILRIGKVTVLAGGTYVLTPAPVTFRAALRMVIAPATYVLTGAAAVLRWGRKIVIGSGAYTYTGSPLTFKRAYRETINAGAYVLTGAATALKRASRLVVGSAVYSYAGSALTFLRKYKTTIAGGTYTYTGTAATLRRAARIVIQGGIYAFAGTALGTRFLHLLLVPPERTVTFRGRSRVVTLTGRSRQVTLRGRSRTVFLRKE